MIYAIVFLTAVVAGIIQNIAGFGASIVMMLVLPRFFDLVAAPALNQAISTGMTVLMAIRFFRYMEFKKVILPMIFYLTASLSVIWFVKDLDLRLIAILFGVFLLALAVYFFFFQKKIKLNPTPMAAAGCGLIGGTLSGLFSIGATAMALYFLSCTEKREDYMGNLQFFLAATNVVSLSMRAVRGLYTADLILPTLIGFAAIFLGQRIGDKISGRLDPVRINQFIYILVGITGIETILKHLL